MKLALLLSAVALVAGCQSTAPSDAIPPQPAAPNIVLFLVDDLGWQDLSVPLHDEVTPFNRRYRTPNLERLAREGVTFTNAFASAPVCTPTRTAIMTGQDPARTNITYWTLRKDQDTSASHPSLSPPAWSMNGMEADQVTLPRQLAGAGYRTIHVGKAHFGAHKTPAEDPIALGFQVNIAGHASGGPASFYGTHNFSAAGRKGKPGGAPSIWDVPGLEKYHGQDIYLTEALTAEALPHLRSAHAAGQPFFLNFCPYAVHAPIMANKKLLEPYSGLHAREAAYATMVETYDRALGELLDELDRLGIADQTLVVFASDNGGLSAHARGGEPHVHNAPLRSGKGSSYEGGVRVPTLIRWPRMARSGSRVGIPIISPDLFPTLLGAAGAMPVDDSQVRDGRDLAPLLSGVESAAVERTLGWHQPHQWGASGPGIEPYSAIRRGQWKLIWFHARRHFELYDLSKDLGEETDLAQELPGKVMEMSLLMQTWLEERGAQLPTHKESGKTIMGPADVARGKH